MKVITAIFILFILVSSQQHSHEGHHHHQDHSHEDLEIEQINSDEQHHEHDRKAEEIRERIQKQLNQQTDQKKIKDFFSSCQTEVEEWISLPKNKTLDRALWECYVLQNSTQLIGFYEELSSLGPDITKQHVNIVPKLFRKYKYVPGILKCLPFLRQFQNKFFDEPKKSKYILQFIREHPRNTIGVFPNQRNYSINGQKTCNFLKVLFQYYYVEVVSSMETLATSFMRALTLRSDIFDHYDIAYCISLQTLGAMSQALEDIDINNIFVKIPDVFKELRYLKLKQQCRDQENLRFAKNIQQALEGMDMFNIMFNDYQPWVSIATQKFGHTQIRLIARQFAIILGNRERYLQLSKKIQDGAKGEGNQQL